MVILDFNQVVIYGPRTDLFFGFYKALVYKRYSVIWVNQQTKGLLNNYDLRNTLFLTGEIDDDIPLREDSFYLLFENTNPKYDTFSKLHLGIYKNTLPEYLNEWKDKFYIKYSLENRELYFPRATELLPYEILENQQKKIVEGCSEEKKISVFSLPKNNSQIYADLKKISYKNYYSMKVINNHTLANKINSCMESNIVITISSDEEIQKDEINEKVFQIISYGGYPVTNSQITADLYNIYCADNGEDLFTNGIQHKLDNCTDLKKWTIMEDIKNEHTYLKRLEAIFWVLMRL